MLKNRRKKIPYVSAGIILICIAVLALLEIRGLRTTGGAEGAAYVPASGLYETPEESLQEYVATAKLPLCYQFSRTGEQVDIPSTYYQGTDSGIVAGVSDSLWLYIAEYGRDERGINRALEELPPFFLGSAYNRNSSYIAMEKTQRGYLAGYEVEYAYGEINLALDEGRDVAGGMVIYDFTVGDMGICIAAMTTDSAVRVKDACRDQAREIAVTMRPNPDFMDQEKGDAACEDEAVANRDYRIEEMAVEELSGKEVPGVREEESGLKVQHVKPMPTPEPVQTAEPVPVPEITPAPTSALPDKIPKPELLPDFGCETGGIIQPPAADPADVNEQSFHAPLTGVAMSVTVTLGFSGNSTVTVLCPDGTVLEPTGVEGNVFSFDTTAQPGIYVVVTTGYSAAGSVRVHVHCG